MIFLDDCQFDLFLGLIVQLHFPKPIELDTKHTVNLVRMLGIILDNAIEGASAAKKKKIELTIIKKNHSVMIRVINTTTNTLPLNQLKQKGFWIVFTNINGNHIITPLFYLYINRLRKTLVFN